MLSHEAARLKRNIAKNYNELRHKYIDDYEKTKQLDICYARLIKLLDKCIIGAKVSHQKIHYLSQQFVNL